MTAHFERLRARLVNARADRLIRVREVRSLGPSSKLAVVEFAGQALLLGVTRDAIALIATDKRR